ncbi:MAG: hypothetical protein ACI8QS_000555 [Planctomycetota bacterium]
MANPKGYPAGVIAPHPKSLLIIALLALSPLLPRTVLAAHTGSVGQPGETFQPEPQDSGVIARRKLLNISRRLAEADARERPWAALLRGDFNLARKVLENPRPAAVDLGNSLRLIQRDLRRLSKVDLTPLERARVASMDGWVRALRNIYDAQASSRTDPLNFTRQVERVLLTLLGSGALPLQQRLALLEAYITKLPAHWDAARAGLITPVHSWALEAAEEILTIDRLLREDLLATTAAVQLGERAQARLEEHLETAADATIEFRNWLIASPGATGRPRKGLGDQTFEVILEALTGRSRPTRILRAELLDVIAASDIGRLTAAESKATTPATPAQVQAGLSLGLRAGSQLFDSENLAAITPKPVVTPGVFPGGTQPSELVFLIPAKDGSYRLCIESTNRAWSLPLLRGLSGVASTLTLAAEGLRRGPSGEALLRNAFLALPESGRMPFLLEPFAEGFGLYSTDAAIRYSIPAESPGAELLKRGAARLLLFDAARLLASIETHAMGLEEAEVLDNFRLRTGITQELAQVEVDRVWHEPLRGAAILGYMEFRALEDTLAGSMSRVEAARRTIALALVAPGVRPVDLTAQLPDASGR